MHSCPFSGFRVAQVRLVFTIPRRGLEDLFPHTPPDNRPGHLAYVEWFTPFTTPGPDHGLYKVSRATRHGQPLCSVIPVTDIERSCHLLPLFGSVAPRHWTSSNVLEACPSFLVNAFADRNMYKLIY